MTTPSGDAALPVPVVAQPLSETGTGEAQLRLALQITAAWLSTIAEQTEFDQHRVAAIRHEGKVIFSCSISTALDLANEALEVPRNA